MILAADAVTRAQVRQAIEHYAQVVGPDRLTPGFIELLESIRTHSDAFESVDGETGGPALLTRTEVADLAGVSVSTVSKWGLPKVGRRYPAAAVYERLRHGE